MRVCDPERAGETLLFRCTIGTDSLSETGIRWGQTRKCDAGGTRLSRNRDMPDPGCCFVTESARIRCPKRASVGVRPESVTPVGRERAGTVTCRTRCHVVCRFGLVGYTGRPMSKVCAVCGKKPGFGNN